VLHVRGLAADFPRAARAEHCARRIADARRLHQLLAQLALTAYERSVNTTYAGASLLVLGLVFPYTRLLTLGLGCLAICRS
jgi:hypothetical protein